MNLKLIFMAIMSAGLLASANAQLAQGGAKFLGNITEGWPGSIPTYTSQNGTKIPYDQYWNQITAENGCKWGTVEGSRGKYNWSGCDAGYNWAKGDPKNRHFKFHALVWGSQFPSFLCKENGATLESTKKAIDDWFNAVHERYPDLEMIDVVNEAIWDGKDYHSHYVTPDENNGPCKNKFYENGKEVATTYIIEALGGDAVDGQNNHSFTFVANAFKKARALWPKAILIYNDYNTIRWQKDQGIYLVNQIKKAGAPVDAYGQQAHDITGMSKSAFEDALTSIHNDTNLPLYITEYDVGYTTWSSGDEGDQKQKTDYSNHIPFLWTTSWIAGITLWGTTYGSTWINCDNNNSAPYKGCSGLIKDGVDRPAMTWLKEYFKNNLSAGKNTVDFSYLQTGSSSSTQPGSSASAITSSSSVKPVAQGPFGGKSAVFPGRLEFENYDVGGEGVAYYHPSFDETNVNKNYRDDDVGIAGSSIAYTAPGEWLEYTVNAAAGEYELVVNAATGMESFTLSIYSNEKLLLEKTVTVAKDDQGWNSYKQVSLGKVTLAAGEQIIKVVIDGYVNLDYVDFNNETLDAPEPIIIVTSSSTVNSSNSTEALPGANVYMYSNQLESYDIFDMQGNFLGRLNAYGLAQAVQTLRTSSVVKHSGVYHVRHKASGFVQNVRIAK